MTEAHFIIGMSMIGAMCFCYIIGGWNEARYWADHADNGDLCHRGTFYRITKKIGQRPARAAIENRPGSKTEAAA